MIGITLICISYPGNKRLMAESFGRKNRVSLCLVVGIRDSGVVCVFQNIVRDRASFWTPLWFRFYINICHNKFPLIYVGGFRTLNDCG